jgi:hypothetical protein
MAAPILQFKRGAFANLPGLRAGEPALTTDTFDLYVGIDSTTNNNKFFGSHRYWTKETSSTGSGVRFVERTDGGSNYIELKAPNTALGSNVTYTLPGTQGASSSVLTNDGSGNLTWGSGSANAIFTGISTFNGLIDANAGLDVTGLTELDTLNVSIAATFASAAVSDLTSGRVVLAGTGGELQDNANLTFNGTSLTIGTGVGVTQFSSSVSTGTSTSSVPTSSAVITYVAAQIAATDTDDDLGIAGDTGTGTVNLDTQSLTVAGTANKITTSASGQTITVSLPDTVNITTLLDVPTVEATNLKSRNGATAITITDTTGAVSTASDLTVGGNLYVNGSTTQVNTTALTVEDRTIDLGIVNGAAPASATTWDLGILFNYNSSGAKKSAVVWEHSDTRFKFASVIGSDTDGSDVNTPQLTVTTFAPIEISSLWVTDCAGTSQVISCTGTTRNLENITIDAGTF